MLTVLKVVLQGASAFSLSAPNVFLFAKDSNSKGVGTAAVARLYFGRADIIVAVVVVVR
jgi:hypothetical protein